MAVPVQIECPVCKWRADWDTSPSYQCSMFKDHIDFFHDRRRNMSAPTIIQQMWLELDKYIELAMTWQGASNNEEGDLVDQTRIEWLDDKLQRTEKTAIGRGLAEAIKIACAPFFENSDQVVALGVKRYQAKKLGEAAPDTPGFMGQVSGEALHIAATGTVPGRPVTQKNTAQPKNPVAPKTSTLAPSKKSAPVSSGVNEGTAIAIRAAHSGGFDIKQIVSTFGVTEEEAREVLANG
ncbi:hypothetical protein AVT65_gp72 [Gordonia phage Gmala1]|uniref:Uncharacterized protein n=1 Tax=Gordonia phage Gmala1 TaxID=1622190 RepID=A0A0E3T801_9CAUD|nr:hypothetical protein AVT65_gp72 [Gordonia phage Gmala1]AKC02910.1 hypothetical protein Gmala1_72 [Gordonia phage Gmala1]